MGLPYVSFKSFFFLPVGGMAGIKRPSSEPQEQPLGKKAVSEPPKPVPPKLPPAHPPARAKPKETSPVITVRNVFWGVLYSLSLLSALGYWASSVLLVVRTWSLSFLLTMGDLIQRPGYCTDSGGGHWKAIRELGFISW